MAKHGKKYNEAAQKVDHDKAYVLPMLKDVRVSVNDRAFHAVELQADLTR